MAVREILKMGDPRLLRVAQPVREFDTPELHALVADMFDTMAAPTAPGWPRRRSASTCSS
jgi:peptide deformylase